MSDLNSQSTTRSRGAQAPLYNHVVNFPTQEADEPWDEFVDRANKWYLERLEKAQKAGAYRAIPYHPGLTTDECGLLLKLAWLSFSEGLGVFAPVRVSERAIAALVADTSKHGSFHKNQAAKLLHGLIEKGVLEVLEEACGRRSRLVALCPLVGKPRRQGTKPLPLKEEREDKEEKTQQAAAAPPSSPPSEPIPEEAQELAKKVNAKFGTLGLPRVAGLIREHGEEEVRRQLEAFPKRDTSGFKKGPVVAFLTYLRDHEPDPPEDPNERRLRIEREYQERCRKLAEEQVKPRERSCGEGTPDWARKLRLEVL